ncbi:hypothetical protein DFP72DRAFT_1054621 [Ephemerocybe angulata]|uniref:Uncharacterized protein n=1 Tax=Ephemerocybe angulata TaxID=980116 RepID=A0A8H6H9P6_9AGAR|nr:hypothetical protein DFP72DRAFT_1054621 [Tulosesus angulatus]
MWVCGDEGGWKSDARVEKLAQATTHQATLSNASMRSTLKLSSSRRLPSERQHPPVANSSTVHHPTSRTLDASIRSPRHRTRGRFVGAPLKLTSCTLCGHEAGALLAALVRRVIRITLCRRSPQWVRMVAEFVASDVNPFEVIFGSPKMDAESQSWTWRSRPDPALEIWTPMDVKGVREACFFGLGPLLETGRAPLCQIAEVPAATGGVVRPLSVAWWFVWALGICRRVMAKYVRIELCGAVSKKIGLLSSRQTQLWYISSAAYELI